MTRNRLPRQHSRVLRALALLLTAAMAVLVGPVTPASGDIGFPAVPFAQMSASPLGGVAPVNVSFDGRASLCLEGCTIASYTWDFGDGATASGPTAAHTYTRSGLFNATLTVTATNGSTGTAQTLVNIFEYTTANIVATPDRGKLPLPVTFDGSGSRTNWDRTIVSYAWDFGDGTTGTGAVVSHTYTRGGVFNATLRVTDSQGGYQVVGTTILAQDPMLTPSNLSATSPTRGTVVLKWTNRMTGVSQLAIERCAGSTCTNFARVWSLPPTFTTWTDTGLKSGATFRYRVWVIDLLGNTAATTPVKVKVR